MLGGSTYPTTWLYQTEKSYRTLLAPEDILICATAQIHAVVDALHFSAISSIYKGMEQSMDCSKDIVVKAGQMTEGVKDIDFFFEGRAANLLNAFELSRIYRINLVSSIRVIMPLDQPSIDFYMAPLLSVDRTVERTGH
jgi:hypothetical protein